MDTTSCDERLMSVFSLLLPVKDVLKQNRSWLILAVVIFLAGSLLPFFGSAFLTGEALPGAETQLGELQKLFDLILDSPPLIMVLMIFLKNFIAVVQMLFLGVLAGISPLATLFLNGYILGVVVSLQQAMGNTTPSIIILGILPHGIFELFAVFLCAALALKLGYHCIAFPLPDKTRLQSFRYIWKEIVAVIPLVVTLLLCAAFIEIFITPHLLGVVM